MELLNGSHFESMYGMLASRNVIRMFACLASLVIVHEVSYAQTVPAAFASKQQTLTMGAGGAYFNVDWGHGHMGGETIWMDYEPGRLPAALQGLGIEAEGRDLNSWRSPSQLRNFRLHTIGGGLFYQWQHFQWVHPYGKCLVDIGSIYWDNPDPLFRHETRTVTAPGLGLEFRMVRRLRARGDYEYQFWPDIAKNRPHSTHILDPQGFTLGLTFALIGTRW